MRQGRVLSDRVKAASKTALAMVLAYGVALSMDWHNAYWAGFAVAFCSLSTVGESLNKGLLRLCGTLLGGLVALTLIAMFPQDRWSFMACMTIFIGFCTFMMFGTSRWYFWLVAGVTVPLLALAGGVNAPNDFQTAILRLEETTLGIVSYSLVWLLLWPTSTRLAFEAAVGRLVAIHRQLTAHYLASTSDERRDQDVDALRREATQVLASLGGLLDGAELDSYETWEAHSAWRRVVQQLAQLTAASEHWRQSFSELQVPGGHRLMPAPPELAIELDRRLADIGSMLEGHPVARAPVSAPLGVEDERLGALSQFQKGALMVYRTHLQTIDTLTRDLFKTVAGIRTFARELLPSVRQVAPLLPAAFDPERLAGMARWLFSLWLTLLISLYLPDVPNTVIFIVLTNSISMALCVMPQAPIAVVFLPYAFGFALGGAINIALMPHLTSFTSLSLVIFAAVFLTCFQFSRPAQVLGRTVALALLVLQMGVTNEQTYNFLDLANLAVVSLLIFSTVAVATYFPVSFRPEHVFRRLLGRFFRTCRYLCETLAWDPTPRPNLWRRLRRTAALHDLARIPGKLVLWRSGLSQSSPEQAQALIDSLQALAYRIQDLVEARRLPLSPVLVRELTMPVRAWRLGLQDILRALSHQPEAADFDDYRAQLDAVMGRLEGQVEAAVAAAADEASMSVPETGNSFRLLGAFRGVAEALVTFARQAKGIEWIQLREDRF
jgi:uncharacterized membrane protein YccC